MAVTDTSGIASPNSSTIRPAMTLPRGMLMSALSRLCLSANSIGLPDSNGRVCPYCTLTKPDLLACSVKRPAGSSRNSKRPSASVSAAFGATSEPEMRTCARRIGPVPSLASTRPRRRPVPVLNVRGPPIMPGQLDRTAATAARHDLNRLFNSRLRRGERRGERERDHHCQAGLLYAHIRRFSHGARQWHLVFLLRM